VVILNESASKDLSFESCFSPHSILSRLRKEKPVMFDTKG
jgi:hypothetical protein